MITDTLILVVELASLFFGVAFVVHISQRWLGDERLRRWMGGRPLVAALKGIAVGFITPFCTYSAIPMLVGLRKAGVSPAGYVAFIVAAPVLDPVLFGALILIVGPRAAISYAAVAFTGALAIALTAEKVEISRFLKPVDTLEPAGRPRMPVMAVTAAPLDGDCFDEVCSTPPRWSGIRREAREASADAGRLLLALGPILALGVAIGLAVEWLVPPETVASIAGPENSLAIPVAAGLGTPLYFSTELFVPIADSLSAVGVGVGAIVALTIAGAGANLPEFVILSRLAHGKVLAIFIGYVFTVAMAGGLLAQTVV